ncbi:hypothetical protein HYFRA_00005140 [Hymenoscyphus fraxineus]|uniref:Uncharacterized protein n=1 Tax=Hymenoscyphus fraxineus TaxID=746836 RepID=A0A9N9LES9_9HELO|nr:hypothetical protein HYFRA_00005140 [Hymenoscyphus fraxineus]
MNVGSVDSNVTPGQNLQSAIKEAAEGLSSPSLTFVALCDEPEGWHSGTESEETLLSAYHTLAPSRYFKLLVGRCLVDDYQTQKVGRWHSFLDVVEGNLEEDWMAHTSCASSVSLADRNNQYSTSRLQLPRVREPLQGGEGHTFSAQELHSFPQPLRTQQTQQPLAKWSWRFTVNDAVGVKAGWHWSYARSSIKIDSTEQVVGSITTINSSRKFSPISRYPAMKQLNRLTTWCRPKDWGNQVQNKKVLKYWSNMTGGLHQVRRGTPQRCGRRCIWKGAKDSYRVLRDEGNHRERRGRWHKLDFRKKVRQTTSGSWFRSWRLGTPREHESLSLDFDSDEEQQIEDIEGERPQASSFVEKVLWVYQIARAKDLGDFCIGM